MKFLFACSLAGAVLIQCNAPRASADTAKPSYHVAATWKLAGDGGWDYLTMDAPKHRLYVARGTRIQVINTDSGELAGEVAGVSGAHGVALDTATSRGYATSGRTNSVLVFDTNTLQAVGDPIAVGGKPDAILFEPTTKHVWAFDAGTNAVSIIDPQTSKVTQTVELGGNPEFGVADGKGEVWVNIENTSEIVELSAADGKILHRIALAPGEEPTGLSYDAANGRLFSGCANKTMVVIDTAKAKVLTSLPIGEGVDATAFDAKRHLAFSSNGRDGTVSVIGSDGAQLALLNTLPTHTGARTMTLDPESGALYLVAAEYEAPQPAAEGQKPRWPKMVPGSAVILQLKPDVTP